LHSARTTPTIVKPPIGDKTSGHWQYYNNPANTSVAKQKLTTTANMLGATAVTRSATHLAIAERAPRAGFSFTSPFPRR
jgi:hypothetical protein